MREISFAPGSVPLCSHIKPLLVMSWIAISATGSKANLATGLSPAFSTLRAQTRRGTRTRDTNQKLRHAARSPWTTLTERPQSGVVKDVIYSVGSPCSGCSWSAQQRLRQSRCWALAASVHGSSGDCGGTVQPQDQDQNAAMVDVDGNVDLCHRPHVDETEGRDYVTTTTSPQDEADRSGSSGTSGRKLEGLTGLEPLVQQVAVALEERCGVHGGDQILVLVSGGSDSVALLVALHKAAPFFQPPLHLEAAHFNHALRGEDSDADGTFVSNLAQSLGIKLHARRWKGAEEGGTGGAGSGMQERARKWRQSEARDILEGTLSQSQVSGASVDGRGDRRPGFIATAHHRDDQAETILLKALRGAHITKMQGMAWVAAPFIRPLLGARKSDVVDFLQQTGQVWREDGSNQVAKYTRNRVRLQLMPLLQDLTGGASALDTRLDELSRQSRLAREMVQSEAEHWEDQHYVSADPDLDNREQSELRWRENGLSAGRRLDLFPVLPFLRGDKEGAGERGRERPLPEFVREELLHRFVTANTGGAVLPYAQLQLLMHQVDAGDNKWSLSLGGGLTLRRLGDFLQIQEDNGVRETSSHMDIAESRSLQVFLSDAKASPYDRDEGGEGKGKGERGMVLYNVSPGTKLHARRRRDGDRFRPMWRDRPTKLKDFLRGQGVPLHRRDEVAVICDQEDNIMAVYPYFAGAEFNEDTTGEIPVHVRVKGTPLWCPRPGRDVQGSGEHGCACT